MAGAILLLGAGVAALLAFRKKSEPIDRDLESKMIGTELAALPVESRNYIFRLLLTNDPANDAGAYAGAIHQLTPMGVFPFTVRRLVEIAKERFG
jgi:hypothetical protein